MNLNLYDKWRVFNRIFTKFLIIFFFLGITTDALAQKIDFDQGTSNNPTASGYTAWNITNGETITNTFDGVTITITNATGSAGSKIKKNWYKNGVTLGTDEARLVSDGISSFDGDDYIKSGSVAMQVTITGLSAGTHTLQAYHNNVDYDAGATLPDINVKVNGTDQITGLVQSTRATTLAASTKSFVTFDVASPSSETVIIYYTTPDNNTTYDRTQLYINSLEFDGENADFQAQNPYPANLDYHVDVDNGNLTMSWTAAEGATKHQVYFGNSESQVKNASNYDVETTSTTFSRNGLNPMQTYYWRVDEVINGKVYRGVVWSFKPRRLAFPGAEGYGRYAIGGRGIDENGGTVYHVTSLEDYNDGETPINGTFRYGLTELSGSRTIVFDVGGVIQLKNRLLFSDKYVTIAGQTAPGNGIMLRGASFGMASDGITRFIRMRRGDITDDAPASNGGDGMGMTGQDYSIMDHCSISWTIDEGFSSRNAKRITLQNTLISEALNIAGHGHYDEGTAHGYAATIGGGQLGAEGSSFHHNLLAHNEGRNWSMSGGLINGEYDGHHDMFNNVCYNWGGRATDGGTHEGQFVNNYYKMGPATTQTVLLKAELEGKGTGTQSYYVSGNIREEINGDLTHQANEINPDGDNNIYKYELSNNQQLNWTVFRNSPFFDHYATVESAEAAFKNVLSDVGCNQPVLDNHDTRMVSETKNGTTSTIGSISGKAGLIDSEGDEGCEGFDGLNIFEASRDADWDTDGDGIPNWFETAKGWSTDGMNNNHTDQNQDYYTDLEVYLNWMACPHFIDIEMSVETEIDLATYFAGYTNPSYTTVSQDNGIGASIYNKKLIVKPTASGLFSVQVKATQSNISLTRTFNFYVLPYQAPDENVYNEASSTTSTETVNQSGNITWAFNDPNVPAVVSFGSDEVNALFTLKTVSVGSHLTFSGSNNNESLYQPTVSNEGSASDDNAILFSVSLADGFTFTPTSISVTATRYGTDGGKMDISWYTNGSSTKKGSGKTPNRDNNPTPYSTYTYYLSGNVNGTFGVKLNLYSLLDTKKYGFKDIIINGTVSGSMAKTTTNVVLKETATVYPKFNNAKETKYTLPINNANVTLQRTLSSEYWNTLCLPFEVTNDQIVEVFGNGTQVSEFISAVNNTINFSSVEKISAGVPCVIKPTNTVDNPVFENVNITSSSPAWIYNGAYHYDGHYVCYDMKTDKTEYFLNTRGTLNYPNNDTQNHLKGLRATFTLPASSASSVANIRVFFDEKMVSEGMDVVDGLNAINGLTNISSVYNLKGQVVGTTKDSLAKGVYVVNGKKVVIR